MAMLGRRRLDGGIAVALIVLASFVIAGSSASAQQGIGPTTRTYFIAADQVVWNYAPAGRNVIEGRRFRGEENGIVRRSRNRIGSRYLKSMYRAYTNASFRTLEPRPADQAYLGLLGPVIRAQVGDTVTIVFRNNTRYRSSIHVHGLRYDKANEGALYNDGTSGAARKGDDMVRPGQTRTYTLTVPERSGPGPRDPSSVPWVYHSHTEEVGDINAGLVGGIIVTRAGMARPDGSPTDVDRELINFYEIFNENLSPYLKRNISRFARRPRSVDPMSPSFMKTNRKHSINGYLFGNQPMMRMRVGERVRWYTMSLGGETDLHTPHWHGNTLIEDGRRIDVTELLPATQKVQDMTPDEPGTWLFHCHVNEHITDGMQTRYTVQG